MRTLSIRAALVLAISSVIAPGSARSAAMPELTERTTVTGDRATWMHVEVPNDAAISMSPVENPDVEIQSGGRLAGILLSEDVPFRDGHFLFIAAVREDTICVENDDADSTVAIVAPTLERECSRFRYWVRGNHDQHDSERRVLQVPAGNYTLHLIAEAPTTVSFTLHGLSGSATLSPQEPTSMRVADNEALGPEIPLNAVYWTGASQVMSDPGFLWEAEWIIAQHHVQSYYGSCFFYGDTETENLTYTPPFCNQFLFDNGIVFPGRSFAVGDGWIAPVSGNVSSGWWNVNVGEVEKIGGITLWLTFGG